MTVHTSEVSAVGFLQFYSILTSSYRSYKQSCYFDARNDGKLICKFTNTKQAKADLLQSNSNRKVIIFKAAPSGELSRRPHLRTSTTVATVALFAFNADP